MSGNGSSEKVRVLVADDAATLRRLLRKAFERHSRLVVVGEAADGVEAVHLARDLKPDVVTMDVNMPRLDGLGAIAAIMADTPTRILVVSSLEVKGQVDLTLRAMEAGALEVIPKVVARSPDDLYAWAKRVADSVLLMSEIPVVKHRRLAAVPLQTKVDSSRPIRIVGLGSSAGGPAALALLLGALPKELPVPVVIAQHMPTGFVDGLIRWLTRVSALQITKATDNERPEPGVVYLPPDGCDLMISSRRLLRVRPTTDEVRPSVDRLFESLASAHGDRALGVILTGMGDDGARGLLTLRNAGGVTVGQDAASCLVYGMPRAAYDLGATETMLPLESIAPLITEYAGVGAPRR